MELTIIRLNDLMADEVSSMIAETFDSFVAKDFTLEGIDSFHEYILPQSLLDRQNLGGLTLVAIYNDSIAGMIEIIDNNQLSLFYVAKEFQKLGIGKELFIEAVRRVKNNHLDTLTVKASLFAKNVYSKLGFERTSEPVSEKGMTTVPMVYYIHE
ncbi:MAG: GNAT family N-acetyltransferase [Spirochaetes bacterium]|jgi:GNAT superfamily N-acetyltransferase|nr:GNAT family N-acetyltransferase [Spirochaetota bacterium]